MDRNFLNPLFVWRLTSVWRERRGEPWLSELMRETGRGYSSWSITFNLLFGTMFRAAGWFPQRVVRNAAWASAIYEWAARRPGESDQDLLSHNWHLFRYGRNQLLRNPGQGGGASIGPFQGYPSMAYQALLNQSTLERLANSTIGREPGIERILTRTRMSYRILARIRVRTGTRNREPLSGLIPPRRRISLQNELLNFDTLEDASVSLIGKIQFSLGFAERLAQILQDCRLPDDVLLWVLLCYESHAENDSFARAVKDRVDRAVAVGQEMTLEDLDPSVGSPVWDRRESLRFVLRVLNLPFAERFHRSVAVGPIPALNVTAGPLASE